MDSAVALAGLIYPVLDLNCNPGILFSLEDQEAVSDPAKRQMWIEALSPGNHARAGDPPQFLCYGDKDSVVSPKGILAYKEKLDALGVPNKMLVMRGAGHGFGDCGTDRENRYRQRVYRMFFGRFSYWIPAFTAWARQIFDT